MTILQFKVFAAKSKGSLGKGQLPHLFLDSSAENLQRARGEGKKESIDSLTVTLKLTEGKAEQRFGKTVHGLWNLAERSAFSLDFYETPKSAASVSVVKLAGDRHFVTFYRAHYLVDLQPMDSYLQCLTSATRF